MDVVYLVRPDRTNEQLRYSLRSLELLTYDRVWIVGFQPSWVQNTNYIRYDPGNAPGADSHPKAYKTWKMLKLVSTHKEISEDFILMNDDFFLLRQMPKVINYHRGPINDIIQGRKNNRYIDTMRNTEDLLQKLSRGTLCYEVHGPMTFNKDRLAVAIEVADRYAIPRQHINKRSFYGNYWAIGGEQFPRSIGNPHQEAKVDSARPHFDPSWPFVSTTDRSFSDNYVGQFVRRKFPEPSMYEKFQEPKRRFRYGTYDISQPGRGSR